MNQSAALTKGLPSYIRAGEVFGGKYRLERELGRGAMGTVWSAVHLTLGQRVAIKLISAEHARSVEARARFSTEAKAAAKLKSRHVVQVYDDGETPEGTPYIVLEYLEGENLDERLERERDLPLMDAARIVGHVGRALSRAHAQGIVHRDLKPGNIFLSKTDEDDAGWLAKVLDFGIAKLDDQRDKGTTKAGTVLGTPLFMSPEQVRGASSVDHRADLYSLGMVFFNMLTGTYAFNGESFGDVLLSICTEPLPSIRQHVPWLPAAIETWFQKSCAREAKDRYQSADEMVEALKLAVGDSMGLPSLSQKSSPDLAIGTLQGHSPPVPHQMPRADAALDAGQYVMAKTQVAMTDPTLAGSAPGTASLTVHEAAIVPKRSAWPIAIVAGLAALVVVSLVVFKLMSSGTAGTEEASARRPQPERAQVAASPAPPPAAEPTIAAPPPSATTAAAPVTSPPKAAVASPPRTTARKTTTAKSSKTSKTSKVPAPRVGAGAPTNNGKTSPDIGF